MERNIVNKYIKYKTKNNLCSGNQYGGNQIGSMLPFKNPIDLQNPLGTVVNVMNTGQELYEKGSKTGKELGQQIQDQGSKLVDTGAKNGALGAIQTLQKVFEGEGGKSVLGNNYDNVHNIIKNIIGVLNISDMNAFVGKKGEMQQLVNQLNTVVQNLPLDSSKRNSLNLFIDFAKKLM
jgi:hypothetical protein